MRVKVGLLAGVDLPPAVVIDVARAAEAQGFDEVWSGEDYFYNGGIAWLGAVLGATAHIKVGIGIVSAVVRHPAVLAMELATLEGVFPGRVLPGIGLGHLPWLDQMGLRPSSPLTAVRECVAVVRSLLAGDTVTHDGAFRLAGIALDRPPEPPPPLFVAGWRQRMIELAGEVGDGALLGVELGGVAYLRQASEWIAAGAARRGSPAGTTGACVAFVRTAVGSDRDAVRRSARRPFAEHLWNIARGSDALSTYGITSELRELHAEGDIDAIANGMPEKWLDDLAIVGDASDVIRRLQELDEAGATTVLLYPLPTSSTQDAVKIIGEQVLPAITRRAP